jgi:hypothetical protein
MIQRGRKSAASLSVIPLAEREPELEPPDHLSPAAAEIWLQVARSRARTFTAFELRVLLSAFACHAVTACRLSQMIARIEVDTSDLTLLDKLMGMRARESAAMARLASRLRLLPTKTEASTPWPAPWATVTEPT